MRGQSPRRRILCFCYSDTDRLEKGGVPSAVQGFNLDGVWLSWKPSPVGVQAAPRHLLTCFIQQWPPLTGSSASRGLDLNVAVGTV